jgi:hypothetical protein
MNIFICTECTYGHEAKDLSRYIDEETGACEYYCKKHEHLHPNNLINIPWGPGSPGAQAGPKTCVGYRTAEFPTKSNDQAEKERFLNLWHTLREFQNNKVAKAVGEDDRKSIDPKTLSSANKDD